MALTDCVCECECDVNCHVWVCLWHDTTWGWVLAVVSIMTMPMSWQSPCEWHSPTGTALDNCVHAVHVANIIIVIDIIEQILWSTFNHILAVGIAVSLRTPPACLFVEFKSNKWGKSTFFLKPKGYGVFILLVQLNRHLFNIIIIDFP